MNILLTNDDGIRAPGLQALLENMPEEMRVVVAAPANERSAASHSISLGQKLRVEELHERGARLFAVHGTPADCVKYALSGIRGFTPDLIISGINQGANTGVSVYYSGTISAAREGFINGVPAIAVSLAIPNELEPAKVGGASLEKESPRKVRNPDLVGHSRTFPDFRASLEVVRCMVERYQACRFPCDVMLNVNIPALVSENIKGVKITKQANSRFIEEFVPEKDHDGKRVFTLAGTIQIYDADGTSDEEAIQEGFISVTPLKLDLTAHEAIPLFKEWIGLCNYPKPSRENLGV